MKVTDNRYGANDVAAAVATVAVAEGARRFGYFNGPLRGAYWFFNIFPLVILFAPEWNWVTATVSVFLVGQWTLGLLAMAPEFYYHPNAIVRLPVQGWALLVRLLVGVFIVLGVSSLFSASSPE